MACERSADYSLGLEETELCLGLPGGGGAAADGKSPAKNAGKRGFTETIDLKLKLQTAVGPKESTNDISEKPKRSPAEKETVKAPAPKAQVVGWPPVRSFRKNILTTNSEKGGNKDQNEKTGNLPVSFVKVSMDGAPYLRKVDIKIYRGYKELSKALENMFGSFSSEFVLTYEDKDGDWMLVGDLPWQMFVDSCKRLRIMKGSEARELAPRGMDKCNNRG